MLKTAIAAVTLLLAGCAAPDTTTPTRDIPEVSTAIAPEPAPTPPPAPPSEPYTYGDDDYLDFLWTRCDSGDMGACDTLYWDAPLGSQYEAFAVERLYGPQASTTGEFDADDVTALALTMVWADMTLSEQRDLCDNAEFLGYDTAAAAINQGAGGTSDQPLIEAWLRESCR